MRITFVETWEKWIKKLPQPPKKNIPGAPEGWFHSHYIGPTSDKTIAALPKPLHAADYIAQQHDLEYQKLGLNGIIGTFSPESKEADHRLIERCNQLISDYENGIYTYKGFAITDEAYLAAKYMREYFILEESLSSVMHRK